MTEKNKKEVKYKLMSLREIGFNIGMFNSFFEKRLRKAFADPFDHRFKVAIDDDGKLLQDGTNDLKEILGDIYYPLISDYLENKKEA